MIHEDYLSEALKLAQVRRGFCAPNPAVGAILVKDNKIIGSGYHKACGLPHAEVEAINGTQDVQGATLYVTLEPCCHHGRTPPCTDLIIQSGIKSVYYGLADPNPLVSQQGDKILKEAGIHCEKLETPEIQSFYQSYVYWHQTKRPFVTAKIALSLDGKIAGIHKQRVAITGDNARTFTHEHRLHSDAILTTANTVNLDDPQLNIRLERDIISKPIYIIDTNLQLSQSAQIFKNASKITVFHSIDKDATSCARAGVSYSAIKMNGKNLDLAVILDQIGQDGCHDLWVEAGGILFQSFINDHLLQRAYVIIGSKILGPEAHSAFDKTFDLTKRAKQRYWQGLAEDGLLTLDYI